MNTNLSSSAPSQLETDCLAVVVLDRSEKDRIEKDKPAPAPSIECSDAAVRDAARDLIASGEVTGRTLETPLLHPPPGLKQNGCCSSAAARRKIFQPPNC